MEIEFEYIYVSAVSREEGKVMHGQFSCCLVDGKKRNTRHWNNKMFFFCVVFLAVVGLSGDDNTQLTAPTTRRKKRWEKKVRYFLF